MNQAVLMDSVIIIDHLSGIQLATRCLLEMAPRAFISAITRAEVLTGYDAGEAAAVRRLLDRFRLLPIDKPMADLAAALRREHGWRLPDAMQAATARAHGLLLATRHTRDFFPDLHEFVRVPYSI
jgi:predicted nucleic acid-binding protein